MYNSKTLINSLTTINPALDNLVGQPCGNNFDEAAQLITNTVLNLKTAVSVFMYSLDPSHGVYDDFGGGSVYFRIFGSNEGLWVSFRFATSSKKFTYISAMGVFYDHLTKETEQAIEREKQQLSLTELADRVEGTIKKKDIDPRLKKQLPEHIYNGHLVDDTISDKKEINGTLYELPYPYNKVFHFASKQDEYIDDDPNPFECYGDDEEDKAMEQGLEFIFFLTPNTPEFEEWIYGSGEVGSIALLKDIKTDKIDIYTYQVSHGVGEWFLFSGEDGKEDIVAWAEGDYIEGGYGDPTDDIQTWSTTDTARKAVERTLIKVKRYANDRRLTDNLIIDRNDIIGFRFDDENDFTIPFTDFIEVLHNDGVEEAYGSIVTQDVLAYLRSH